jgi:hypothetical protein
MTLRPMGTELSINFYTLLKTIAILGGNCLPLPNLGLNLSKRHNLNIFKEIQLSLVQYFYKLSERSSKIVLKVCRSPVLLKTT